MCDAHIYTPPGGRIARLRFRPAGCRSRPVPFVIGLEPPARLKETG